MTVLGIETSCDETAAAVYEDGGLLSSVVSVQLVHQRYGGVVPEFASRAHLVLILPIINQALSEARRNKEDVDGIAVTYGPGLVGSILVGLNVAKALALSWNIPWIAINHIEGHIFANFVEADEPSPPFVCLIVSGGHTQLVLVEDWGRYALLGKTKDDAAGEAFDKVARILGLGYPGGPAIDSLSKQGDPTHFSFPRSQLREPGFDFSYSGLKTAVLYQVKSMSPQAVESRLADLAASFQAAVVEVLIAKTLQAVEQKGVTKIALAGGVAGNSLLRQRFGELTGRGDFQVFIPPLRFCTDNAAMIARAGHFRLQRGERSDFELGPQPSLRL